MTWVAFVAATLLPVMARIVKNAKETFTDGLLRGMNCFYITPICTSLGVIALLSQALTTLQLASAESVDTNTLQSQSIVFAILGLTWLYRLLYPSLFWQAERPSVYWKWYLEIGWSAVNSLLWAIIQGVLWYICTYVRSRQSQILHEAVEWKPLLG